jgi:hypothetical protein
MLLLPPEYLVQHSFDSVEKHRAERKPYRECSPATSWLGEHGPLDDVFEFCSLITQLSGQRLNYTSD